MKNILAKTFCSCVKKVQKSLLKSKTFKILSAKSEGQGQAIAICVKSVLQTRGRTLKKFRCGRKPSLKSQKLKKKKKLS
jgi:hypothetical protein